MYLKKIALFFAVVATVSIFSVCAQGQTNYNQSKFKQLHQELPTPNVYRNAAGAPGHQYYQQQANYHIKVNLNEAQQKMSGLATITYTNNSPDALAYLWMQLDQNIRHPESDFYTTQTGKMDSKLSFDQLRRLKYDFEGGFNIAHVKDKHGKPLAHTIVKTMMRIDLPQPLKPGQSTTFSIQYWYNLNDIQRVWGRSGYEYFPADDNCVYVIAQFYPRMCHYGDVEGWQNKQFLGRGEFTLSFGNYRVEITVPADHAVSATGTLQNPNTVLTPQQSQRLQKARTAPNPIEIITQAEATQNEKNKTTDTKTWVFEAKNVRDFAFASSRKFIWDAMGVPLGNRTVMAMSFYPKEGNPLWGQYSTRAVAHTVKTYSKYTFDYPYPVAQSIHAERMGMEYPMICFNFGRPDKDGTYPEAVKYGMIGVIIHEVGHNFFPMIVNSDERQWTWMDEGLNSFLQYLTEQEWEPDYPSRRGPAWQIAPYMAGTYGKTTPIMTNSESIFRFGDNAYGKPASALNILRETILGRQLFDFAFKTYAQRWMFKHPSPADFFRTMEDASGIDLDWFWRGWFYTTDYVDIAITDVKWYRATTKNPEIEKPLDRIDQAQKPPYISDIRNRKQGETLAEQNPEAYNDFYNTFDKHQVQPDEITAYQTFITGLDSTQKKLLALNRNYYQVDFENIGGLVMPIILQLTYADSTTEVRRIPAEIWRYNNQQVSKVLITDKPLIGITLDPYLETADAQTNNNYWPRRVLPSRFELYERKQHKHPNLMKKYGQN